MELLRTCQITGKTAVACIIDGIPSVTTQNAARAGRYEKPESLFEGYISMLRVREESIIEDLIPQKEIPDY
nr:unnamed protein product [Callosobruchus analis]